MKKLFAICGVIALAGVIAAGIYAGGPPLDLASAYAAPDYGHMMIAAVGAVAAAEGVTFDEIKGLLAQRDAELDKVIAEARTEIAAVGKISNDTNAKMEVVSKDHMALTDAFTALEQKLAKGPQATAQRPKSIGKMFAEDERFLSLKKAGQGDMTGKIEFKGSWFGPSYDAVGIFNAPPAVDAPLVRPEIAPMVRPQDRPLTVRDLLPVAQTDSNIIFYPKENVFTNAAAGIYDSSSPTGAREGVVKPESGLTFTSASVPVETIAHWVPASRQVLDDVPMLQSYIDDRLRYGLKLVEEAELLNGDGTPGHLNGLVTQATAYNRGATGDTQLDTLRKAILQARIAEYNVDGIVLNPIDWTNIELLKDGENRYLIGDPRQILGQTVWGRRVVDTNSMTAGNFLTGAFRQGAQIWDRMAVNVEIARQHSDFFIRNMVAILCEERLALVVYRPASFIKGTL